MSRLVFWLALLMVMPGAAAEPMRLTIGGQVRTYLLERPDGQAPQPTIVMLHGGGVEAAQEARVSGLGALGPRQGFAVVFPQGIAGLWNFFPPGKETAQYVRVLQHHGGVPDDLAFLRAIVAALVRDGVSDPNRIHLAGRSLGGIMVLRLACTDAGRFAAIAVLVSAMPEAVGSDCEPARPLPVLVINGTRDRILPYKGERTARHEILWSTQRLIGFFRQLNTCSGQAHESALQGYDARTIVVEQSTGCAGGPVVLYRIVGGGHEVPADMNAGQRLLDFFRDKAR